MTTPEARRHDLYHGLEEVLGPDRADTLMAYLPSTSAAALATQDDIADVKAEIQDVRTEIRGLRSELRDEIHGVNQRIDRLFLTMAAGFVATTGAVVADLLIG